MRPMRLAGWIVALFLLPAAAALASCPGPIASLQPRVWRAALQPDEVGLTFLGHASFLIESAQGASIVTDYSGVYRPKRVPDIVTMNNAHSTHYTDRPDPGIKYVLRGWADGAGMRLHDISYLDVRVRNVPTNARDWGSTETRYNGNSIFIYEVGDLCIAHLGHLHHTLTPEHLADIGQIDVLLVPVDGSYTLDTDGMIEVIDSLKPALVVPMHFFGTHTLQMFLTRIKATRPVRLNDTPYVTLSRASLPKQSEVLVLPGY